jgi:hypothetical protein
MLQTIDLVKCCWCSCIYRYFSKYYPVLVQQFTATDGTTYFQVNDGLGNNAAADTSKESTYTYNGTALEVYRLYNWCNVCCCGTANNFATETTTITNITKLITSNNATYGESSSSNSSLRAEMAVTNSAGAATPLGNTDTDGNGIVDVTVTNGASNTNRNNMCNWHYWYK